MATGSSGKRQTTTQKKTTTAKKASSKNTSTKSSSTKHSSARNTARRQQEESMIRREIGVLALFAVSILLLISNFGVGGAVGNWVSSLMFGLVGLFAYVLPVVLFLVTAFSISNKESTIAIIKITAMVIAGILCCCFLQLVTGEDGGGATAKAFYTYSSTEKMGGGFIGGMICKGLAGAFGLVGTWIVLIVLMIICLVIITERSFIGGVKRGSRKVYDSAKEDAARHRMRQAERAARRRELELEKEKAALEAKKETEEKKVSRLEKKVSGVALNTTIQEEPVIAESAHETSQMMNAEIVPEEPVCSEEPVVEENPVKRVKMGDVREITLDGPLLKDLDGMFQMPGRSGQNTAVVAPIAMQENMHISEIGVSEPTVNEVDENTQWEELIFEDPENMHEPAALVQEEPVHEMQEDFEAEIQGESISPKQEHVRRSSGVSQTSMAHQKTTEASQETTGKPAAVSEDEDSELVIQTDAEPASRPYVFPPLHLLKQGKSSNGNSERKLQETALHLQQILRDFGVGVTVTDVSCGPAVTRYELQPDQGVKVSRIVALADDIKLNLAVADVRIEAPIPGKAAVGIEVPNAENATVSFRELISSDDFQNHKSRIAFAVGKDIGGKIMVADIMKMPHLLIAGATGSGKSVCINTLIMSILYKADPSDVKLIMVDPKVVELSVYNGIPHLLIPVVTDPKKAAAALNWAVAEMMDRYKKFAECNVRNLQGYNEKIKEIEHINDENKPKKLPQIVIVVDELADLMMVASGEVEDAICRLAQLARAAGIHLIIATQRPSVNVITGLIKANMPSRIAFAVSSGVDSRTIIDMNGAEKLLGKGDMLFYPSGLPKPVRVQGAFVSDEEVGAVVDFLSQNNGSASYSDSIEEHINNAQVQNSVEPVSASGGSGDGRDALFAEAGRFIIEKDKASIGMLQRWFKVGFNRAARIMDQLADAGVVGEEAGTKPREILMTMEEFEQYMEESL